MKHGWEIKKLGEVCEILDSQRKPVTKKDRREGCYPYYGASGIQDYVDSYIFDGRYLLVGEDGAKWGANDKSAFIIEGKCWVNNHAHILKVHEVLLDSFVECYLVFKDLSEYITGAVVPKLTQQALKSIPIPIPPLPIQERIVSELDCINGILEKKREQIKELDALAQSIFYDMFGDPIQNEKGWEVKKLKNITSKIGSGATPKGGNQAYKDFGINLIRSLNVHNNQFLYKDLAHIDEEQANALNNVIIEKGDVLLNITGASVARCCIVPNDVLPARVNQHVAIIRLMEVSNIFLANQFTSVFYQQELLSISKGNGATREALTKAQLENLNVILPPLSLQQAFAAKIEAIEKQKELVKRSIAETEMLLASRMQHYFSEE